MINAMVIPEWCAHIIEDTDASEYSIQCLYGGFAMYYKRMILNNNEIDSIKKGIIDYRKIIQKVCQESENGSGGLVESLPLELFNVKESLW